jgi:hypothetical protein
MVFYKGGTEMTNEQIKKNMQSIQKTAINVITNPAGFFRDMKVSGGFIDPLLFAVVMGVIAGFIRSILSLIGFGYKTSFFIAIASVVITPILIAIFGFVGAAILFVIWKLLGSGQPYETAYRCGAYAAAIVPITSVLGIIPYLGVVVGLAWMMYLMVLASIEVHKIDAKKAWIAFGILFAVLALVNVKAQIASRSAQKEIEKWGGQVEKMNEMTPEQAGKAMGEFLKGMQKAGGKE